MQQTQTSTNLAPQVRTLLNHLQTQGSISQAEASTVYRIRALPRRIADLKEAGYKIRRELKNDATGQRYARYYLEAKQAEVVAEAPAQVEPPVLRVGATILVVSPVMTFGDYVEGDKGEVTSVDADGDIYVQFPHQPSDVQGFLLNREFEVIA